MFAKQSNELFVCEYPIENNILSQIEFVDWIWSDFWIEILVTRIDRLKGY